jgi:UDP-glucose 4-epimerase
LKYLITGNKGYIGTNLTIYLISNGNQVRGIDKAINMPISYTALNEIYKSFKFDGIFHLAGLSGIDICSKNPEQAALDNLVASQTVFEFAKEKKLPVVFTSSQAAVYPANLYGTHKRLAEEMVYYYNSIWDTSFIALRLSNVYGGSHYILKKKTVVANFIKAFKSNRQLMIHNEGKQVRNFIHVFDVCQLLLNAMININTARTYICLDAGSNETFNIMEVANEFINRGAKYLIFKSIPEKRVYVPDIDMETTEKVIGFKQNFSLKGYIVQEITNNV